MATVIQVIGESPADGSIVSIEYDDQTLIATRLDFDVTKNLGAPLIVNMTIGGTQLSFQAPPSANQAHYTFPTPIQGVTTTGRGGFTGVSFGISEFNFAEIGANVEYPPVIHVTANT